VVEDPPEAAAARPSIRYKARTVSLRPSRPSPRLSRAPQGPAPAAAPAGTAPAHSVRVDQEKLDTLMGAIGELLVAKNALPVLIARIGGSAGQAGKEIKATVDRIAHITDDLQDAMRQIRMMPIRSVSQRFPRMIRDLARSQSKQVQLIISGDEIELDKTVLEHIGDPLVHLVRNAVDHGLEPPDQRLARGKPEMGTVGFTALKEGSHVVIRISDDGRGMSPERLRAKAVEKGLLSQAEAAELSDKRALELILLPGLSTAEVVTDISGRGVGMDVVQSNIRQLHGTIAITSEPGHGSAISIKLPTSLMVSKGMLVECGSEQYVLPIEGVREMVKFRCDQVRRFRDVAMMSVRGTICPVYSLGRLLGLEQKGGTDGALFDAEEASAAIVSTQTGDIAVVVDRLVAEIDVIVKPLSGGLDKLMLFQGATILGDGSVALIIDVRRLDALTALDGARDPGAAAVAASA
jgi:two-component system chemotaxis sensor kinase CheA